MQTTDHDLTLADVLQKAMELTVNEDGERMFENIPEEEDLAMLDPARPVPVEADGVEADATTAYANDVDVEIDDDDLDLDLLGRFEDFDDEALEGAMKRQAAEGNREEEGNRRAFAGIKKGFLGPRPPAQPAQPVQPAQPAQPPVVGDVRERGRTSSGAPPPAPTTTEKRERKPLSKFKQQQLSMS